MPAALWWPLVAAAAACAIATTDGDVGVCVCEGEGGWPVEERVLRALPE